jgi:hypothetical protein
MAEWGAERERAPMPPIDAERLHDMIDGATAFTQKTALSVATLPIESRAAALETVERGLRAVMTAMLRDPPIVEPWLQANMAAIRELIAQIELSGAAAGGTAKSAPRRLTADQPSFGRIRSFKTE